jgi:hypothetical protein
LIGVRFAAAYGIGIDGQLDDETRAARAPIASP